MKHVILAISLCACHPSTDQIAQPLSLAWEVERTSEREWRLQHGLADYRFGAVSPPSGHPLYNGDGASRGAIRLLSLHWDGVELLRCGHCFSLIAANSDAGALGWQAGGGHAMETAPYAVTWAADGTVIDLAAGDTALADNVALQFATGLFTNWPGANPNNDGRDNPFAIHEHRYTFYPTGEIHWHGTWFIKQGVTVTHHYDVMHSMWPAYSGGGVETAAFADGTTFDLTSHPGPAWHNPPDSPWVCGRNATVGVETCLEWAMPTGYSDSVLAWQFNTRPMGDVTKAYHRAQLSRQGMAAGDVVTTSSTLHTRAWDQISTSH